MLFGSLQIDFPVIQAALSGYSDPPMRRIAKRFGAEFTLCEVMLDQFVISVSKGRKSRFYLSLLESDHPCGAQLMGSEPEMFVSAAKKMLEFGFDLIDLNFACPVKKVLGRGRGGSLLKDPVRALEIVEKVRDAIPPSVPLTVKLRKGFDDTPESEDDFYTILDGCVERGVVGVTVHGRTVKQKYEGLSDWNFIRKVKQHIPITVLGSGDLFDAETCMRRLKESEVDGLALARGIIGNPWLFAEIKALYEGKSLPSPPDLQEQREVISEHFRLSEEQYGNSRSISTMRGIAIKYAQRHPEPETLRKEFAQVKTRKELENILQKRYR